MQSSSAISLNRTKVLPILIALAGLVSVLFAVYVNGAPKQYLLLVLVGAGLGATLFLGKFGFGEAFRALILSRDVGPLRVHAFMCALAAALFFPLLAYPSFFGLQTAGAFTPIGIAYLLGAFMFGAGMQLGGGCASGTLYKVGWGNMRLLFTVLGFIIGSTIGAQHMGFWWSLGFFEVYTMHSLFGWEKGFALHIGLLLFIGVALSKFKISAMPKNLLYAGLVLAVLNALVLILSGQPWGEAPAFALWGSKVLEHFGVDVAFWEYWQRPAFGNALEQSIWRDSVTIVDFAIVFGALLAAALTGEFYLRWCWGWLSYTTAILGGIMMGYGARLANGCNIGAYFSGLASGSLSAWAWLFMAILGSAFIVYLKKWKNKGQPLDESE